MDAKALKYEMYAHKDDRQEKSSARKEDLVRRYSDEQSKARKVKQRLQDDKIVIDLHANELLETTNGMSAADILDYQLEVFRKTIEQYKCKKTKNNIHTR